MPDIRLRSTRNRSEEPTVPPRIRALPWGPLHLDAASASFPSPLQTHARSVSGWGDTEGPAFPARGQQGSSSLQWWGCCGCCRDMTSGGATSLERATWGLCRVALRGGTRNSVLTASREESGSASARGTQNPLSSSKAAPTQRSWK